MIDLCHLISIDRLTTNKQLACLDNWAQPWDRPEEFESEEEQGDGSKTTSETSEEEQGDDSNNALKFNEEKQGDGSNKTFKTNEYEQGILKTIETIHNFFN